MVEKYEKQKMQSKSNANKKRSPQRRSDPEGIFDYKFYGKSALPRE